MSTEQLPFTIVDNNVELRGKVDLIPCMKCKRTLAVKNESVTLYKTSITLIDNRDNNVTMYCGFCKTFNSIEHGGHRSMAI